jgi:ABC-type phosphate transport system substrate-binding protein
VLARLVSLLRLVSLALCLIVGVSFLLFVVNSTSNASAHQQRELNNEMVAPTTEGGSSTVAPAAGETAGHASKSSPRKTIDEVAHAVESPFTGITESWSSEWLRRGVLLLLSLAVYGFGLSFLARAIRVRL